MSKHSIQFHGEIGNTLPGYPSYQAGGMNKYLEEEYELQNQQVDDFTKGLK